MFTSRSFTSRSLSSMCRSTFLPVGTETKFFLHETAHRVCGFSWVTESWFQEKDTFILLWTPLHWRERRHVDRILQKHSGFCVNSVVNCSFNRLRVMTHLCSQASNSASYIQDAFQLLMPILEVSHIQRKAGSTQQWPADVTATLYWCSSFFFFF